MGDKLFDLSGYKILSSTAVEKSLTFVLKKINIDEGELKFILENVVHHTDINEIEDPAILRIDDGGTSYGHDFALRLKRPEIIDYKVLYLFGDMKQTGVMFKALAEIIKVPNNFITLW